MGAGAFEEETEAEEAEADEGEVLALDEAAVEAMAWEEAAEEEEMAEEELVEEAKEETEAEASAAAEAVSRAKSEGLTLMRSRREPSGYQRVYKLANGRFEARAFRQDAYLGAFSTAEEAALAIARDGRQRGMMSLRGTCR